MPHQWTKQQLRQQVKNAIYKVFDAAKTRDFGILAAMHYPSDELFSKFDYSSPYKRQTFSQALMHEEVAYANITDFNYKIDELRIDLISQEVAIATFHLETGGLFVNDYRFEGSPARAKLRASLEAHDSTPGRALLANLRASAPITIFRTWSVTSARSRAPA